MKRCLLCILVGVSGFAATLAAETVHTVDGEKVEGTLKAIEEERLVVAPKGAPADQLRRLHLHDLHRIVWVDPKAKAGSAKEPAKGAGPAAEPTKGAKGSSAASQNAPSVEPGAQQPRPKAAPGGWRLELVNGDRISGELVGWREAQITLKVAVESGKAVTVDVPVAYVRHAWHADDSVVDQARQRGEAAGGSDVAYIMKDDQPQAVTGQCLGIEDGALRFRFMEKDRKVTLDRVVGLALASETLAPAISGYHQRMRLFSGGSISGAWTDLSAGESIALKTAWGDQLTLPLSAIAQIDFVNGRLKYLSTLAPDEVEQVPYFDRIMPYRINRSLTGGAIMLADGRYEDGIAVHARCALHYDIGGRFDTFRTTVGFQQPEGRLGRAAIRVLGDGKPLFEQLDAHGDDKPIPVNVAVKGVQRLTLEVDFGQGQGVSDRVVWADARLVRSRITQ